MDVKPVIAPPGSSMNSNVNTSFLSPSAAIALSATSALSATTTAAVIGPAGSQSAALCTAGAAGGVTSSTAAAGAVSADPSQNRLLDKRRLGDLVKEVDELEQLDEDVEEMLMEIADDFIDNVVAASCQIAKHRKANTVEVKDVLLHLEHNWNMWTPGFGSDEVRPYKKSATTEAHRQRLALIKKVQKKL